MHLPLLFLKQKMMRKVLWSLVPLVVLAIYLFGWRVLVMLGVVTAVGIATEYLMLRLFGDAKVPKVSEAVLVSCCLFVLTLPPATPFWVGSLGIIFGVFFAKGVFGGFGKNVFNPALVGRCFIYISFPKYMTMAWSQPFPGFPGGFSRYSQGLDALTSASPLIRYNQFGEVTDYLHLVLGTIPGSIGETSAVLILLAAVYLIYTKTASWRIMGACSVSFFVCSMVVFRLGMAGSPLFALLSGGFLFGVVYMATDPITAPKNETTKILYGLLIGFLTVVIRVFSVFTEGIMFAILIANTFVPLMDMKVQEIQRARKVKAA